MVAVMQYQVALHVRIIRQCFTVVKRQILRKKKKHLLSTTHKVYVCDRYFSLFICGYLPIFNFRPFNFSLMKY